MSAIINSAAQITQNKSSAGVKNILKNTISSASENQNNSGGFKAFLSDQASGFINESKDVEKKVALFSQGKADIESVASEVAAMTIKVDAAKRVAEEVKTGIHSLLNMQM